MRGRIPSAELLTPNLPSVPGSRDTSLCWVWSLGRRGVWPVLGVAHRVFTAPGSEGGETVRDALTWSLTEVDRLDRCRTDTLLRVYTCLPAEEVRVEILAVREFWGTSAFPFKEPLGAEDDGRLGGGTWRSPDGSSSAGCLKATRKRLLIRVPSTGTWDWFSLGSLLTTLTDRRRRRSPFPL
ncbi:hypothetical protein GN956_G16907 [Arapaima gigas]